MGQVSPKLRSAGRGYSHWCPGCDEMHLIAVHEPFANGAKWTFDGDVNRPTFSPSINIYSPRCEWGDGEVTPEQRCHYFLRAGRLEFLGDCTHALKGQTVDLPDLPPHVRDAT